MRRPRARVGWEARVHAAGGGRRLQRQVGAPTAAFAFSALASAFTRSASALAAALAATKAAIALSASTLSVSVTLSFSMVFVNFLPTIVILPDGIARPVQR